MNKSYIQALLLSVAHSQLTPP